MGIGVGIFLIALGAILTFAVDWTVGGLNLHAVGWILMIVGVGGLILFFYFWNRRRAPQFVTDLQQRRVTGASRTYGDPTPPPLTTATTVTPLPSAPLPVPLPPPQVTTVSATAPVVASSQSRRPGS
jgi:hypothetical protein